MLLTGLCVAPHLFSHTDLIKSRLNLESKTNNEKTGNTCSVRGPGVDRRGAGASTVAVWFWRAASNRRGKKTDGEGEQHKCPEGIDRYVDWTRHLSITQLITIGSGYELN